jgi:hypothetical protein
MCPSTLYLYKRNSIEIKKANGVIIKTRYGVEYMQSIKISKYSSIDLIPNEINTPN